MRYYLDNNFYTKNIIITILNEAFFIISFIILIILRQLYVLVSRTNSKKLFEWIKIIIKFNALQL